MKQYTLRELLQIKNGKDHKDLSNGNIPVYGSGGIMRYANKSIFDGESILLPRKGSLSNIQYVNKPFWTVDTLYYTIINKNLANTFFLYNYLKLLDLRGLNSGTGVPSMTFDVYYDLEIFLPDIAIQTKIASVLSSLASKIELNNRINTELEAIAKTLYDFWFVQFDFPDVNGKSYKTFGGKMVWNKELNRKIPEGWEVGTLNNNIELIIDNRGKTPLKLGGDWTQEENGIIALSAKIVKGGKLVNLDQANKVSLEMYEKWMPTKLREGDILMTSEAPLGEFYYMRNKVNYCLSQRLFAIRSDHSKVLPTYLYYELSKGHGYSQIIGSSSGSTVFGIRQDVLREIKILKPNLSIQKKFEDVVAPLLLLISKNEEQNQQLSSLRDWLLPMLMNGQVKVKDTVEEIAMSKI